MFSIFEEEVNSSAKYAFVVTAWSLNFTNALQIVMYALVVNFYKPCQGILRWINKNDFNGLGKHFIDSIDFIAFFLSHYMAGEELMILVNLYYDKNSIEYQAYGSANKVNFLIQKIIMAFSFLALNLTGTLIKRRYLQVLNKFLKVYFIYSFFIVILAIILFEAIAYPFATILTNDEKLLELIPSYIRLIAFSLLPNHLEISLQSIITGFKKQKILAYISLITVILGGFSIGYLTIFFFNMGIYGVFLSMFIIELMIGIIAFIFFKRIEI
jgi:Na+-driven multidrug efflux pump